MVTPVNNHHELRRRPPRRLNLAGSPSRLLCWHRLQEGSDSSKAYLQDWSSSPLGTWMDGKKHPFSSTKKAQQTCVTHIPTVLCMSYIILYNNIYIYRYKYRYILYKILERSSTNRIAGSLKVKVKLGSSGPKNSDHSNSLWNPGLIKGRSQEILLMVQNSGSPIDMWLISRFTALCPSLVVQDFFHQQFWKCVSTICVCIYIYIHLYNHVHIYIYVYLYLAFRYYFSILMMALKAFQGTFSHQEDKIWISHWSSHRRHETVKHWIHALHFGSAKQNKNLYPLVN